MSLAKTTSVLSLFVVLIALVSGCGRTDQDANVARHRGELVEIYEIYQLHRKNHERPPASMSDLKQYEAIQPTALQVLREGKYLVVWGLSDKGDETVLAYEKDAPTNGGWAVLADGTVKRMDAEAFQAVPKGRSS